MKLMILILVIQAYSCKSGLFITIYNKINILFNVDIHNDNIPVCKFKTENNTSQIYFDW